MIVGDRLTFAHRSTNIAYFSLGQDVRFSTVGTINRVVLGAVYAHHQTAFVHRDRKIGRSYRGMGQPVASYYLTIENLVLHNGNR